MKNKFIEYILFALLIIFIFISYNQYKQISHLKNQLGNSYMITYNYASSAVEILYSVVNESKDVRDINFEVYSDRFNALSLPIRLNYEHSTGTLDYYFEDMARKCSEMSKAIESNDIEKINILKSEIQKGLEKGKKIIAILQNNGGKLYGHITYKDPIDWYNKISKNRSEILRQIRELE